ncbi:MFS transporter [Streptomyces filipinensis]|uniref:MFS transporter n=1 Tax=Streptomyces filipinensis TaxID=66887 RepID=A0A918MEI0_9ACTN|nr:MFS transporter [Streptomyces filipinensis]GGV13296.1 MFS transporter [Streptomyces filipinensis]
MHTTRTRRLQARYLIGLMLLAVNLRAAITCVGPVLEPLRSSYHLSSAATSVLTALPIVCLGVFAAVAPPLGARLGSEKTITAALLLVFLGVLVRSVAAPAALFAGTILTGAGIATGNVLVPAVIKQRFPGRIGSLTGLVMMLMAVSGAVAAASALPLDHAGGLGAVLAVWAVPAALATAVWGSLAHTNTRRPLPSPAAAVRPAQEARLSRSPLAWAVAAFLGIVSLLFYTLTAWLPEIMQGQGFSATESGTMLSVLLTLGIPFGLAVPTTAARRSDQRVLVAAVVGAKVAGLAGIFLIPEAGWLWMVILGFATGSAFPLAMTLISLRTPDPATAARLSGMAQTCGYLLAATGPLGVGLLHTLTGGWNIPLLLLLLLVVPETAAGLAAARPGFVVSRGKVSDAPVREPA